LGEQIPIHSSPDKTKAGSRFWIFAGHVSAALRFLSDKPQGHYHIVGQKEVDNLDMAQMIAKVVGKPLVYEMVDFHSSRPGHDLRYGMASKYMGDLGWELPSTFEESLELTVRWYLDRKKEWLWL
jgi:dTDP-glucose 4,6-dehydratase